MIVLMFRDEINSLRMVNVTSAIFICSRGQAEESVQLIL